MFRGVGWVLGVALGAVGAWAATVFDGTYTGAASHVGGVGQHCAPRIDFSLAVRDGSFSWNAGGEPAVIQIGADGSFSGRSGRRTIMGQVAGRQMTASTEGDYCQYSWSLTRLGA